MSTARTTEEMIVGIDPHIYDDGKHPLGSWVELYAITVTEGSPSVVKDTSKEDREVTMSMR